MHKAELQRCTGTGDGQPSREPVRAREIPVLRFATRRLRRTIADLRGLSAMEYALLAGAIAVPVGLGFAILSGGIQSLFASVTTAIG
jgi:Flp pilus assembly pilin Flp